MILRGVGLPIIQVYGSDTEPLYEYEFTSIPRTNYYNAKPIEREVKNILLNIVTINKDYRQEGEIAWDDICKDDLAALLKAQSYQGQKGIRIVLQPRSDDDKEYDIKFVEPLEPRHDSDQLGKPVGVTMTWMQVNVSTTCDDITII